MLTVLCRFSFMQTIEGGTAEDHRPACGVTAAR
jgi:hypothetical protein